MADDEQIGEGGSQKGAPHPDDALLLRILAGQDAQGRLLHMILELLTASRDGDGPSLSKLLEGLVARIGEQTAAVQALAVAVARLGRDLPLDLVAAIDDNLDIPHRTTNGCNDGSPPS